MYLNPEEKDVGKENFCAAIGSRALRRRRKDKEVSSREFLEQAAAQSGGSAAAVRAFYFGYEKTLKDPLKIGVIGTGAQGCRLIAAMNPDFVVVKSIADIRPSTVSKATTALEKLSKEWKPKQYGPYKELLDNAKADGLEAVVIALPSHLHAAAAKAAIEAGLHVFVETPLALSVADGKDLIRTLNAKNKEGGKLCLAVGHQRRYSLLYDNAAQIVKGGLLGSRMHYIRTQWHCGLNDWKLDVPETDKAVDAKQHGYKDLDELCGWKLSRRTSGGMMMELGCQLLDAAALFLDAMPNKDKEKGILPLSVSGGASQLVFNSQSDVDDHVYGTIEFPVKGYTPKGPKNPEKAGKKIGVQFVVMHGNNFDGYGEVVLGTDGTLILEGEKLPMLYKVAATTSRIQVTEKKNKDDKVTRSLDVRDSGDEESAVAGQAALLGADAGFAAELEHWAWCARNPAPENRPHGDAKTALAGIVMAIVAAEATHKGTRIEFKPEWFDVDSDETPDGSKPEAKAATT